MARATVAALALAAAVPPAAAQEVALGGQIRPRFEFRDSLPSDDDAFTSMRVRGSIGGVLDEHVSVFVQFQDVRLFGEETGTLSDFRADNLDLHQGWVEVRREAETTLSARVGRQEIAFAEERLIGTVNWTQQGRSFDGARLVAEAPEYRVDVFATQLADATAATNERDAGFLGAYGQLADVGPGAVDLYALFNTVEGSPATDQVTLGGRWAGEYRRFRYRGEATYQTGERGGLDVSAFMFGLSAGAALLDGTAVITLWYDYLSGDDDPDDDEVRVFDTLFATNHPLYGLADFFTNIPRDTRGRGLQDAAIKSSYRPLPDLTLKLDLHSFHLAKSDGLGTGHLAEELDLTGSYALGEHLKLVTGFSYLVVADGFAEIGRLSEDATWGYAMLDASF